MFNSFKIPHHIFLAGNAQENLPILPGKSGWFHSTPDIPSDAKAEWTVKHIFFPPCNYNSLPLQPLISLMWLLSQS